MQNKTIFYFHFDIFIFENKMAVERMQLDGQFAEWLAAVEFHVMYMCVRRIDFASIYNLKLVW